MTSSLDRVANNPEQSRIAALEDQLAALRFRLDEAEETLRALGDGEVDAVVIGGQVYTLAGTDAAASRLRGDALAQMEDAVVATDTEQRVIYMNPAAERRYGRTVSETLGLSVSQLYAQRWLSEQDRLDCEQALAQGGYWRGQTWQVFADQNMLLECTFSCMIDLEAKRSGYLAVMRDMSARANAEAALAESQARLDFALQSAQIGDWSAELTSRKAKGSARTLQILGLPSDQGETGVDRFFEAVHSDDRHLVRQALRSALETNGECHLECRIFWPDRSIHWIELHGSVFLKESQPDRMVGIVSDITIRKVAEQALHEADRRKDDFLATLAHELRNPLAPIRNAAHVLAHPPLAGQTLERSTAIILRQVAQMARLLDDLLDVARITRGKLGLRKDYITLQSVIATAVETARPVIDSKAHRLKVETPEEPIWIEGDPVRLAQVISNLLNNAAKYTDQKGSIVLRAGPIESGCYLSVSDSGIGLSPEALRSVFGMFAQEATALDRSEGGLGIGLALVKGLVELHGGTVEAFSRGIGYGSEFTLRLPATKMREASTVLVEETGTPGATGVLRFVIADDNHDAADSLATLLELQGHIIFVANDGISAFDLVRTKRPAVALLDIGMPGLNGYEVAQKIRQEAWGKRTLLIATTGWGQEDDRFQAFAAGFNAHLTKPFNPIELQKLLDDFSERKLGVPV
jgi:PAS domain S-box-containing protein